MSSEDGFLLTAGDIQVLRAFLAREAGKVKRPTKHEQVEQVWQTPDVYIARTPAGGIEGYTTPLGTDSGSDAADAHYGYCQIYRIRDIGSDVDVIPISIYRDVWNLSREGIAGDTLIGAIKDKTGKWLAFPFSGGAKFVRFTLPSALAKTDASKAACTVDDYWGGATPGATITAYNLPASANYIFSGASGNKGLAAFDERNNKYWIIQLEC